MFFRKETQIIAKEYKNEVVEMFEVLKSEEKEFGRPKSETLNKARMMVKNMKHGRMEGWESRKSLEAMIDLFGGYKNVRN
jgi:hypothetical protein